MVDFQRKSSYNINDLLEIMKLLRGEGGCPWDREQNHKTIRKNFLEETYEVLEAIDKEDSDLLREELGDVLLQVVFHSRMEEEEGRFNFGDVCDELCQKLIIRHPHVFGEVTVSDSGEVLKNWDNIKQKTKKQDTYAETLESVPAVLPALMRSQKVGQRAARAGMDFESAYDALNCLKGEIGELEEAVGGSKQEEILDELGDVLFSTVNLARKLGFDSEEALTRSCEKFIRRFSKAEQQIRLEGKDMKTLSIDELDAYWKQSKQ